MQVDTVNGRNTELETLTGYVVKKARELQLTLGSYEEIYGRLAGERRYTS
jgi:ketopantoate reductase